ncbi:ComEA family DNA-binding protein [Thermoproteota archaeon]
MDFYKKKFKKDRFINYEKLEKQLFEKVDINKAKISELKTIPGVGEKMARAIVEYRQDYGEFEELTDLKGVSGIKDWKFQELKDYITISK